MTTKIKSAKQLAEIPWHHMGALFCSMGVRRIFGIPDKTQEVRYTVFEEPTEKSVRIRVDVCECCHQTVAFADTETPADGGGIPPELLRTLKKHKKIPCLVHVECEAR